MPIDGTTDIQFRLSGGAGNTDPSASLGGAISSTSIVEFTTHNLFDYVDAGEAAAGDTEYRCMYVINTHATLTWSTVKIWIGQQTVSNDTSAELGVGTSGVNGTEQTIAGEGSAPSGVTFYTSCTGYDNGLTLPDLGPGEWCAVWGKRILSASSAAYVSDWFEIGVGGYSTL